MPQPTILLIGLGALGTRLLDHLVRVPNLGWRIVVAGRNLEAVEHRTIAAVLSGSYFDHYPNVSFTRIDLRQLDETAETIAAEAPDIIVNTATMAAWWVRDLLPAKIRSRLDVQGAGPGLWAAGHLALANALMCAIRSAGAKSVVINAAYPDVVNPALAAAGHAPIVGIGNIDLLVPALKLTIGRKLGVPMRHVVPYLVMHNHHSSNILRKGTALGVPYYMKVMVSGTDVTKSLGGDQILAEVPRVAAVGAAAEAGVLAAGSLARTLLALMTDSKERAHAPGPAGLPGGYPVQLSQEDVRVLLPDDISLKEAIAINEAGQRAEGIERIEADGSLVLTSTAQTVLHEVFGFKLERYRLDEALPVAAELGARLNELARSFGLHLPVH